MNTKYIFQAVSEALGDDFIKKEDQQTLINHATRMNGDDDSLIEAIKQAYGTSIFSPNVEHQVRVRVHALEQNPKAGVPGSGGVKQEPEKLELEPGNSKWKVGSLLGDEVNINKTNNEAYESGKTKGGASGRGSSGSVGNTVGGQNPSTFGTSGGPGAGNQ